jgi:hypothetical protein
MDHIISGDESETIKIHIKAMDWASEITDLFRHSNKDTIHQAVQGLRTRYNGKFDATILLDQLDQLQTPDPHWAFTSLAPLIGVPVCIFAVGICIWKVCCWTKDLPMPAPSAQPMPVEIMTPQLATTPITAPATAPSPVKKPAVNNRAVRSNNTIPINITIT